MKGSFNGLVVGKEDINKNYQKYLMNQKIQFQLTTLKKFSKQLTNLNKEALLKIRRP